MTQRGSIRSYPLSEFLTINFFNKGRRTLVGGEDLCTMIFFGGGFPEKRVLYKRSRTDIRFFLRSFYIEMWTFG